MKVQLHEKNYIHKARNKRNYPALPIGDDSRVRESSLIVHTGGIGKGAMEIGGREGTVIAWWRGSERLRFIEFNEGKFFWKTREPAVRIAVKGGFDFLGMIFASLDARTVSMAPSASKAKSWCKKGTLKHPRQGYGPSICFLCWPTVQSGYNLGGSP